MESWPLQLVLTDDAGREHAVGLTEATVVRIRGLPSDPGELTEGQRVECVLRETEAKDVFLTDDLSVLD
jgi:hypothetical protein